MDFNSFVLLELLLCGMLYTYEILGVCVCVCVCVCMYGETGDMSNVGNV